MAMDQPKIERMLRMMKLLTGNVDYTVDQLAERLDASRRSIYRYIDTFRDAGFVVQKRGEAFRLGTESQYFKDISQLVHFTREEAYVVNQLIEAIDDTNILKQNLKRKLASVYNFRTLAQSVVRGANAANVHSLIEAIEQRRQVVLRSYSSSEGLPRDRRVEPFAFTTNYVQVWCYEPQSAMCKLFKTERIGSVELLGAEWEHEAEHREDFIDIFRMSGRERHRVRLRLGRLSCNLLREEYPLSNEYITQVADDEWLLSVDVADLRGVARFVVGVADDVRIEESAELKAYIRRFVAENLTAI